MENITIKQLAKELNLSIGTVSKALRDSHEISPETKQKVFALAQKLHFVPNPYASSLRQKKSKTIAVVFPEVADSFFSLAINGIESVAQAKGYHVLIYLTHESFEKEQAILQDFGSGRVDGVLISPSSETALMDHIQALREKQVPVVFFDRGIGQSEMAQITTNDFSSAYEATRHLLDRGCQRIGFLSVSRGLYIMQQRLAGYQQALVDANRPVEEEVIVESDCSATESKQRITAMLQMPRRVDGVFASVEQLAMATYQICEELNLSIPEQVKVLCYSNLPTAALLNPSLTTVTQPAFDMGKAAATVLFKALEKRHFNAKEASVQLPSRLFPRLSTGMEP